MGGLAKRLHVGKFGNTIYRCFCAMLHVLLCICGCVRLIPVEYSLRTVPTNSKLCLRGLLNMREKKILASVIGIQKEN